MTKDFEPITEVAIQQEEFGEGGTFTSTELRENFFVCFSCTNESVVFVHQENSSRLDGVRRRRSFMAQRESRLHRGKLL